MRLKNYIYFILLLLTACKKAGTSTDTKPEKKVDIYVAGFVGGAGGNHAAYWKNGDLRLLTRDKEVSSTAYGIAANKQDVYLAGFISYKNGIYKAAYWKNGVPVILADDTGNARANAIAIDGDDVYVAGYTTSGIDAQAVYWKNGVMIKLLGLYTSEANAIFIQGKDVYIAGKGNIYEVNHKAVYWKNGEMVTLWSSTNYIDITGIAVNNSDVFVAGNVNRLAVYWKNGKISYLEHPPQHNQYKSIRSLAKCIKLYNNDIYITGCTLNENNGEIAVYWKNGVPVRVPDSKDIGQGANMLSASIAFCMDVYNDHVYAGGYNVDGAVYWKDGMPNKLAFGSVAYDIVVVPQ